MIKLKSINLKNFRSWEELNFTDIDKMGLVLLNGKNGTGKTSYKNAVEYLLLDKFSDEIMLSDIPFNVDTECKIEGVFDKDDDVIKIVKYRNHKKFGQSTVLELNGNTSLTHTDRRETQKEIFRLFDIDIFSVMTTSIYSSQSKSFIESLDSERKDIIYKVLGLLKFNKGKQAAKDKIKELGIKIEHNELKIEDIKQTLINQEEDLEDVVEKINQYDINKEAKIRGLNFDISSIEIEPFDKLETKITDLEKIKKEVDLDELESLNERFDSLKLKVIKKETEIAGIELDITNKKRELLNITYKISNYDEDKKNTITLLKHSLDDLEIESTEDLEDKIKELNKLKVHVDEEDISDLMQKIAKLETSKTSKETELNGNRKRLKEAGDGICPIFKSHQCDLLINQRDDIIKDCEPDIKSLEKDIKELGVSIEETKVKLEELIDLKDKNVNLSDKISIIEDDINEIETDNLINENKIQGIKDNIEKLKKEENPYIDIKNKIKIPEQKEVDDLQEEIDNIRINSEYLDKRLDEVSVNIQFNDDVDEKIEIIKEKVSDIWNDNKLKQNNILNFKDSIKNLEEEENPHVSFKKKINKKIKINKEKVTEKEKENKKLFEDNLYYKFWLTGFGKTGLPSMLSDDFLISLEDETNKILSTISRMHITITPDKENKDKSISEKIDIKLHHPDKKITSIGSYSAGQRQRVKLANLFALHKLISNLDFMILDESLEGSLDIEGKEQVIDLLKQQIKDIGTIIVISHDDDIKDSFENIMNVGIKDGISYLKED